MRELGLSADDFLGSFITVQEDPYALIEISSDRADRLAADLGTAVRRCYISDVKLNERKAATGLTTGEIVGTMLPDPGSTMAGDFGEILTALIQSAQELPTELIDPWKWRLKADRTKPAGGSDVVQFVLPNWPESSSDDRIICSEVKTKSTNRVWSPVHEAIEHSKKDSDRRLPKTLVWLKERAINTGLEGVSIDQLERFIDAIDHPPAQRDFRAVAVICSDLIDGELTTVTVPPASERALVIISVPALKDNYEAVFKAALHSQVDAEEL